MQSYASSARKRLFILLLNDALKSARRRATMEDDEDVKGLVIAALDTVYYQGNPYFMDTEKEKRDADADLLEIIMDLRKQVRDTAIHIKTLSDRVNGKRFTPRAEKSTLNAIGRGNKGYRTCAGPLADGGLSITDEGRAFALNHSPFSTSWYLPAAH
ncbi:hypothetical protein CYMTET_23243 [Cymbomonas tetramitiformis]|uniref:Uncharacterized protein n=1 Tax=Cymbomonas tetramitiformis TaxID=36881 RepID=A0AAE0FYP4_9CHLO|nr:hypothetical protein CYMTET_23243 [Cymbomonas tetramitiformis]